MTTINTNIASLIGTQNLQRSQSSLQTSLTRLSTGLQINSGEDNPAGLVASNLLGSQIASINQSITNSNRANDVLSTAASGLGQVSGLLDQIRSLVQAGLNSGALSPTELAANQNQIDQALSAINDVSANTSFAGDQLIDGSKAYITQTSSADAAKLNSYQINSVTFGGSSNVPIALNVQTAATKASLFYNFVNNGLATKTTLQVSGSSGSQVVFLGKGSSLSNIQSAINAVSNVTGVDVTKTAAVYGNTTFGTAGSNNGIKVNDIQAPPTNPDSSGSETQTVTVKFAAAAANDTLGVASTSTATTVTLTVTLGAGAGATVTSTASSIKALLDTNANSSGYVSVTLEGNGSAAASYAGTSKALSSNQANAFLTFQSQDFGSAQFVGVSALTGTFTTTVGSVGGAQASRNAGTDIQATINGQQALGDGLTASVIGNALNAQITVNAADNVAATTATISVTGGGSVFQIGQNANVAGQINIGLPAVNTAVLGGVDGKIFQLGSGGGFSLNDVGASVQGNTLVSIINEAINQVSTLQGNIGALQANVINTNIATLNSSLQNVTQAKSDIADTNFAAETSNLTRAQILEQAGISVLSIANQTPSQILKLLP